MKILLCSTDILAKTGYGRVVRELIKRLSDEHEFIYVNMESPVLTYGARDYYDFDGVKVLVTATPNPLVNRSDATSILKLYFDKYGADIILGHWDVWAIGDVLRDTGKPYLLYIPIDAKMTEKWSNWMRGAIKIILYSKFAYNECLKFFHPSKLAMIYHGVDTEVFKPLEEDKSDLRRSIEAYPPIPEDCFLFVNTAVNFGCRKLLYNLLLVFRKVVDEHPEAHLYMHTNPYSKRGYDLPQIVNELGLKENVHFPPTNILFPITDEGFARIYNAADVYVSLSCAEGFGLPLLEAASCGIPIMAPDNSSQTELVKGAGGWLIESVQEDVFVCCPPYVPTIQYNRVPNMKDAVEKMIYAVENPEECEKRGKKARIFALSLDWDKKIIPQWRELLREVEEELEIFKEVVR